MPNQPDDFTQRFVLLVGQPTAGDGDQESLEQPDLRTVVPSLTDIRVPGSSLLSTRPLKMD
jgi:hypothetical protein